jgi:hypothetical protein
LSALIILVGLETSYRCLVVAIKRRSARLQAKQAANSFGHRHCITVEPSKWEVVEIQDKEDGIKELNASGWSVVYLPERYDILKVARWRQEDGKGTDARKSHLYTLTRAFRQDLNQMASLLVR